MAEYLLRHHLRNDAKYIISSAGLHAASGLMASAAAIEVLREKGIDLTMHCSQPLTKEMAEGANLIAVMTNGHIQNIRTRFPSAAGKTRLLTSFGRSAASGRDIQDPIGCSTAVYREIRDEIDAALLDMILFLQKGLK
ncbi:MAG: low molecular weight protein arginine phosphatase [Kiritimatiellia bacterium]|jgi:protein-tyrosine-phosphatase